MYVDTAKLRGRIVEKGLTQEALAAQIGIDSSTFSRKMGANGTSFTIGQMHQMAEILMLSGKEAAEIFLQENSQECEKGGHEA